MYISDKELEILKSTKTEKEWSDACDLIKYEHNGYPLDWFAKVLLTGMPYNLPWYTPLARK